MVGQVSAERERERGKEREREREMQFVRMCKFLLKEVRLSLFTVTRACVPAYNSLSTQRHKPDIKYGKI